MEKCGWRRVIVYYAWGSFSVAVNLTIPSSPLIGIPVSSGRGPWRGYTGAPAELRQPGEAVGAPTKNSPPGSYFFFSCCSFG
jgi:hypothetical protein